MLVHPDELFQCTQIAYDFVFGGVDLPWEWRDPYRLRNALYPIYLSWPLWILKYTRMDYQYLVLISPYSWLEEYTELNEWFGAGSQDGNDNDSFSELQKYVGSKLTLTHQENIPFLIREHERKFQYGVSHVTVWKKLA